MVPSPAGRHYPLRRESPQALRGHLPVRFRRKRLAGPVDRPPRGGPILGRSRRQGVPGGQPAHEAVRLLGMAPGLVAIRVSRPDLLVRGVHAAPGDGAPGAYRLHPVLHVLHVAQHEMGARDVHDRAHPVRGGRLLPAQLVAEHAGHPERGAAVRRTGRLPFPARVGRHTELLLRHLRSGLRAAGAPAATSGLRGIPQVREVRGPLVGPPEPAEPRALHRSA